MYFALSRLKVRESNFILKFLYDLCACFVPIQSLAILQSKNIKTCCMMRNILVILTERWYTIHKHSSYSYFNYFCATINQFFIKQYRCWFNSLNEALPGKHVRHLNPLITDPGNTMAGLQKARGIFSRCSREINNQKNASLGIRVAISIYLLNIYLPPQPPAKWNIERQRLFNIL